MNDNTNLKTAAAYIRVSTDSQTELSPASQIKVVRQFAKQHGYIIPKEFIFRDDGISGRTAEKRPQFNQMIATAKQKPSRSLLYCFGNSRALRGIRRKVYFTNQCFAKTALRS